MFPVISHSAAISVTPNQTGQFISDSDQGLNILTGPLQYTQYIIPTINASWSFFQYQKQNK